MEEVAPAIHRIESDLGPRFMAQYLLVGQERSVLVDTGLAATPDAVLLPALEGAGVEPDLILISHADLDHCGGNRRMRERYPRALLACHELDRPWIESNVSMLTENYLWHEPYGFDQPDENQRREMLAQLGGDAPVDLGLRGGETIRIAPDRRLEILHLPGHTPGHIGLWDPRDRVAAREFCDRSLAHVDAVETIVREERAAGESGLRQLTERVNLRLGPYPEFSSVAAGVRSHLSGMV